VRIGRFPEAGAAAETFVAADPTLSTRPFTLAVTGHRNLAVAEASWLGDCCGALLDGVHRALIDTAGPTARIELVSALAAGADQLLAMAAVARPFIALHALLPYGRQAYRALLAEGIAPGERLAAVERFDRLYAEAAECVELDSGTSPAEGADRWLDDRYRAHAGALVRDADLLVAVWRGTAARGPGGTAEVVALAVAAKLPVLRLDPARHTGHEVESGEGMDIVHAAMVRYARRVGVGQPVGKEG
jgi:hypothetical protein